ncbi:diguanylate cyclase [Luteimonas yindakuii]|uniref:diguanylate cyclase n=1 Tax=Luteimonas yindakuii TaxID=2565782 RepID=A0A4Z1R5D4_9GAMM|nr:GGDEF domain-containing protein [Luteimonas yindakuii]TKS54126.1 diguanylate cyclase [Luteimonas yindakuii]
MPPSANSTSSRPPGRTGTALTTRAEAIGSAELRALFAKADQPPLLLAAFADGMAGLHDELGDMGRYLQAAYGAEDWVAYGRSMRQLIDKYIRCIELEPASSTDAERLREALRQVLGVAMGALLQRAPALAEESGALATRVREWRPGQDLGVLTRQLAGLCTRVGLYAEDADEQLAMLVGLFELLLENIGELLDERSWLHGQITRVRGLLGGPMDRQSLQSARAELRDVIYRQGLLRQGIADSRSAMKDMMAAFVERLDGMAVDTGEFHDRITRHALRVREARSITDLQHMLDDVLVDTARVQAQALRARDDLLAARHEVEARERHIQQLEQKLRDAAGKAREDQLTGCLNRRGFEERFDAVAAAAHDGRPLCLAMLDLDDFRALNAAHGHLGGDAALRHVVEVARLTLRASDVIARFGGEEFVVLMPETPLPEALAALARLRTVLQHRALQHEGARITIAFSAGVALSAPGEALDALLKRADLAMYQAKRAGKDRSIAADDAPGPGPGRT